MDALMEVQPPDRLLSIARSAVHRIEHVPIASLLVDRPGVKVLLRSAYFPHPVFSRGRGRLARACPIIKASRLLSRIVHVPFGCPFGPRALSRLLDIETLATVSTDHRSLLG
jgi:hypothetical protein